MPIERVLVKRMLALAAALALPWLPVSTAAQAPSAPVPLVQDGQPVDWWFVFKFNAKSFPQCPAGAQMQCPFGATAQNYPRGQTFVFASNTQPQLAMGSTCVGETGADPLGATFGDIVHGKRFYVVWNDQFYGDPELPGCSDSCSAPWGHAKGVLAWDASGSGVLIQVTTPSWPGAGRLSPARSSGNTLGCIPRPDNVLVSQSFFSVKLTAADVLQVLRALANASVVTAPGNAQLVNNGGPQDIQDAVKALGIKSKSTQVLKAQLSSGVILLSKPSKLLVPPWQLVSSQLDGVSLRVATWWANPAIPSTRANTPIDCWDASLPKPGAVQIATSGSWKGTGFGLKGGAGPDFNHAKVGVSTSGARHFVIFGDMNQQGSLSTPKCGSSQNGRGGLFFILDNEPLWRSVTELLDGKSAPLAGQ
ncbi:deoxyribonuclease II family protein [Roseateles puraquae]|uniref:deoxyribonuclease II family protein n=1 Tax=Roseateles puraquae TaxID=431059 RepID=UPI001186AAF5|nr:deoxyribonuclease II family protein [Roseateles puraquae]MDG0855335.1 hypothetical protein [Roseateles puraquae]